VRRPQPSTAGGRIKIIATLAIAVALGTSACAHPQAETGLAKVAGCSAISPENPQRQQIEADITAFVQTVPAAAEVRFEVQDCVMDGQLYNGKTIVLSARLARLPQPQRFFIIAHEYGHHQLDHQMVMGGLLARIAGHRRDEAASVPGVTELAHRTEFEADAYAVRLMHMNGMDPDEAALLFDGLGAGKDNATHPAFGRRAQAIRDVRASLVPATTAQSKP
jgi:Zn-dependent protease with chaperone function